MLTSRGKWEGAGCSVDTVLVLDRACRAHALRRSGLLFDTRFSPGEPSKRDLATILLVLEGSAEVQAAGVRRTGPHFWVASESEFERRSPEPGALCLRTWGSPALVFDLSLPASRVALPVGLVHGPRPLDEALRAGVLALFDAKNDGEICTSFAHVARTLEALGVLRAPFADELTYDEPAHLVRLWVAMRDRYERHDTGAQLDGFAQQLLRSPRQTHRDVAELVHRFGLDGFRSALKVLRLRRAVLLLSARATTVSEVARMVGYGSSDAMARAFRDERLPAPGVVREAVLFPEG